MSSRSRRTCRCWRRSGGRARRGEDRQERIGDLADVPISREDRQDSLERSLSVASGPQAVIAAERQQTGPCANPPHQKLHGLRLPVVAVEVAQQDHVELLQGRRVRGNPRQLQALHVGPLDEHVRPGLDQGTEFEVGVPGEEPLRDRPVLGSQRPLEVEHPDLAIDDLDHDGPMVVLGDLLFGYRRYADRVGVSSLDGGHELKGDLPRSVPITQDDLGLVERFTVSLQDGLDDLPAKPGLADVGRDPGPVVHGQLLGAFEVGHPRIAIRGAIPQAVAHPNRMHDHSELAGRGHGVARGVVNPIREEHDGLDVPPRDHTRPSHQSPGKRRRLAGRLESREIAGPVQRRGLFRKLEGSSCVSGGYKLEFAAIAFTASTYKRWREQRKSRHKCLSHKSLR